MDTPAVVTETILPSASHAARHVGRTVRDTVTDRVVPVVTDTVVPTVRDTVWPTVRDTTRESVLPAVARGAEWTARTARELGGEAVERAAHTEPAQELVRRAALVAAGARGQRPARLPTFAAGIAAGLAVAVLIQKLRESGSSTYPVPPALGAGAQQPEPSHHPEPTTSTN